MNKRHPSPSGLDADVRQRRYSTVAEHESRHHAPSEHQASLHRSSFFVARHPDQNEDNSIFGGVCGGAASPSSGGTIASSFDRIHHHRQEQRQQGHFSCFNFGIRSTASMTSARGVEDDVVFQSSDLNKLTREEREEGLYDLHGVAEAIQEEPSFVQKSLDQLQEQLTRIKLRPAYDKVLFLNPHYVMSRNFRLLFLRADRFDTAKAARRLVDHFELKLELFGYECLGRPITMENLDNDSKELFRSGAYWLTDSFDRSGRKILLFSDSLYKTKAAVAMAKMHWYMHMNGIQNDEKAQKNGIVNLILSTGTSLGSESPQMEWFTRWQGRILASIPIRVVGIHWCFEDKTAGSIQPNPIAIFQAALNLIIRVRFRAHCGSIVELKYALLSYGIHTDLLPLDDDGNLLQDKFKEYLQALEEREIREKDLAEKSKLIIHPTRFDVLLGRGRPYQDFPGNIRLGHEVDRRREEYEESKKNGKSSIAMEIALGMKGRFLKRKETVTDCSLSSWEEIDFSLVHRKISNTFQTRKRLKSQP